MASLENLYMCARYDILSLVMTLEQA